jgi:hypothetical protein
MFCITWISPPTQEQLTSETVGLHWVVLALVLLADDQPASQSPRPNWLWPPGTKGIQGGQRLHDGEKRGP